MRLLHVMVYVRTTFRNGVAGSGSLLPREPWKSIRQGGTENDPGDHFPAERLSLPLAGFSAVGDKSGKASGLFSLQCADPGVRAARTGRQWHAVRPERPERKRRAGVRINAVAIGPRPGMEHGDLAFTRHGLVLCDVFCNLGIQLGELAFDQGQTCLGLAFQDGVDLNLTAVAQARALLDQRCSRNLQLAKTLEFLRDRRIWFQSQCRPHACQFARINRHLSWRAFHRPRRNGAPAKG